MTARDSGRTAGHAGRDPHEDGVQLSLSLERRILLTRAALFWENLCACFWPLALYVGALAALSLLDFWGTLPGLVRSGLFWISFAGFLYLTWRGLMRFQTPSRARAIERLERGNRLTHRPIAALADAMAAAPIVDESDNTSRALWREHIRRARARIGRPKVGWPSPDMARRDPRALRVAVLVLLAVGFAAAGPDWPKRLLSGFTPSFSFASAEAVSLDAWIAPPAYTGHAPAFLHSGDMKSAAGSEEKDKVLRIPQGSKLIARRGGGDDRTEILANGKALDFRAADKQTEEISYPIEKDQTLAIRSGGTTLGTWKVAIIPDQPPAISFMKTPSSTVGYALHVQFGAADDYGVESVTLKMNRPGDDKDVVSVDLPTARGQKSISGDHYQDLTNNPWAGEKVIGRLEARDAIGQVGVSDPVEFVLPQREFTNPIAKKLIALRQHLKDHPEDRASVKASLAQITDNPKAFDNDLTTALALGDSYWRLQYDRSKDAIDTVRDTLWKTAVHLENDKLTRSRADLRALTEQLKKALAEGAPQAEIERLMKQLQAALDNYLRAMQAQAKKQNGSKQGENQQQSQGQNGRAITPDQLRKMLDQARNMSQTGARQAASQLLSQLQSILENLSTQQAGAQQNPAGQAMQKAISELDALARKQQSLMDQTFQQSGQQGQSGQQMAAPGGQQGRNQGGQGQQGKNGAGQGQKGSMTGLAGRQGDLQKELQKILQSLGSKGVTAPQTLDQAGSSMGQAKSALGRSDSDNALGHEGRALQSLRTGIGQLVDQVNRMISQGEGSGGRQGSPQGTTGGIGAEHVDLPSDADVQRSREILDELRRRSGQWQRPREERDYINRLLDVY